MKVVLTGDIKEKELVIKDGQDCLLKIFLHKTQKTNKTVFIIPGGAYGGICVRENEPIAKRFFNNGFNACYINYCVGEKAVFPNQVIQCRNALDYIALNADEFNIDKNRIVIIGFSAGAHLAGLVENLKSDVVDSSTIQPFCVIYCYPVVSSEKGYIHERSFRNLLKDDFNKYINDVSLEKIITKDSAPSFIFHCIDDREVDFRNSLILHNAYIKNNVSSELHLFSKGGHGVALPTLECFNEEEIKYVNQDMIIWVDLCLKWLKERYKE